MSENYSLELEKFTDKEYFTEKDLVFQFPFNSEQMAEKTEEEKQRIANTRREQGNRLKEQMAKKREAKIIFFFFFFFLGKVYIYF